MTDLSPMKRAVRALEPTYTGPPERRVDGFIRRLADLRTSDPKAFAAVLAQCGVPAPGVHVWNSLSEGQAVIEGRVVELEVRGYDSHGALMNGAATCYYPRLHGATAGEHPPLYRVKPERSDRHMDRLSTEGEGE